MSMDEERVRRAKEYDAYNQAVRDRRNQADAASEQIQIQCANEILTALTQHIKEQMERYGKGDAKYQTYSKLKEEITDIARQALMSTPDSEKREKNISQVIDIMKRTGEASRERRHNVWDSIYQFVTGRQNEVKSWFDFKSKINEAREKIAEHRESPDNYGDYAKELHREANKAVTEPIEPAHQGMKR